MFNTVLIVLLSLAGIATILSLGTCLVFAIAGRTFEKFWANAGFPHILS